MFNETDERAVALLFWAAMLFFLGLSFFTGMFLGHLWR